MDENLLIEREKTLFESLAYTLNMTAIQQLGKTDSLHKNVKPDFLAAQDTLDILIVLHKKTAGNLSEEESRFLDNIIANVTKHIGEMQNSLEILANAVEIEVPED